MPPELELCVNERKLKTVKETGKIVDDYVRARKGTVQKMRYHKCGQKGHLAGSCLTAGNSAIVSTDDKMDLGQQQPMPLLCSSVEKPGHAPACY